LTEKQTKEAKYKQDMGITRTNTSAKCRERENNLKEKGLSKQTGKNQHKQLKKLSLTTQTTSKEKNRLVS
jgi:hypothetical protein